MAINYIQYSERVVGKNHPTLADVVNRPLRDFITILGANPDGATFIPIIVGVNGNGSLANQLTRAGFSIGMNESQNVGFIEFYNPSAALNEKRWKIGNLFDNTKLQFFVSSDDGSVAQAWHTVTRTGSIVTDVSLAAGATVSLFAANIVVNGSIHGKPLVNSSILYSNAGEYSLTGSNATPAINILGTWNTTGNPTAINLDIVETAAGASSKLINLRILSTNTEFYVSKVGVVNTQTGSVNITLSPLGSGSILLANSGAGNVINILTGQIQFEVASGGLFKVLGPRITGWAAATGTPNRTTFATGSVTLSVLAEHVKALIDDLMTHGMIGT